MIHRTARFRVRQDQLDRCLEAIHVFVAAVGHEPGTRSYLSLQDETDPRRFLHVMSFNDEAAEQAHTSSAHVKAFTEILYPSCEEGPEFSGYSHVAG